MVLTKRKATQIISLVRFNNLFSQLEQKVDSIALIGLGYVGLPIALEFAKHFKVMGFDINSNRVKMMQNQKDPSGEIEAKAFKNKSISFSDDIEVIKDARFFVIAVPTPIDKFKQPDLSALRSATHSVAQVLKKGDFVIFESTVYPGCTEEICVPILEKESNLKLNTDFKVGYSPERINPGDKKNTIDKIVKIVSGSDEQALDTIAKVYGSIISAGIHKAPSIKVAEAAKIVENTQRDINIALMNELSMIFENLDINTFDVLEAAGTKWNFLNFYPGLVGGHCIGVDPYYLIHKSIRTGHNPILISAGRSVNDGMPKKVADKVVDRMEDMGITARESKVLVMGITFKENVTDIRNSKAADLIKGLQKYCGRVDIVDPLADPEEVRRHYNFELRPVPENDYDAIVLAVSHDEYCSMGEKDFSKLCNSKTLFVDVKGIKRGEINRMKYCSL